MPQSILFRTTLALYFKHINIYSNRSHCNALLHLECRVCVYIYVCVCVCLCVFVCVCVIVTFYSGGKEVAIHFSERIKEVLCQEPNAIIVIMNVFRTHFMAIDRM